MEVGDERPEPMRLAPLSHFRVPAYTAALGAVRPPGTGS
jgi:hypothetical protein